jgi:coenzyme F420-reducing hydrogenase delta subunit/NAD-dependent dihydropyrimidine dehydrogenase PreA subunit
MSESEAKKGSILVDEDKCVSCGICIAICPHDALSFENGFPVTTGKCKVCGLCAASCITKAITMKALKFRDEGIIEQYDGEKVAVFACRRLAKEGCISVMCSARIDIELILDAFEKGASGVIVAGCEDCRNETGSREAEIKVETIKKLLREADIEEERVRFVFGDYEKVIDDFTAEIDSLGEIKGDIALLKRAARDRVLRSLVAKMRSLMEDGNVYGEKIPASKLEKLIEEAASFAVKSSRILNVLGDGAEIKEIAKKAEMDEREVVETILEMRRRGVINFEVREDLICCPGV